MSRSILCIGGMALDRKFHLAAPLVPASSNPAVQQLSHGGVARNVAETLTRLGAHVVLVSRVGKDAAGDAMVSALQACSVDVSAISRDDVLPTAEYVAVLDFAGELAHGLAAMQVLDQIAAPPDETLRKAAIVFADCNLSAATLKQLCTICGAAGVPLYKDAVSTAKVKRLPEQLDGISALFLNCDEAAALTGVPVNGRDGAIDAHRALAELGCNSSVISAGAGGVSVYAAGEARLIDVPEMQVVDVTGAGDALIAGTLLGLEQGLDLYAAARIGTALAARTLATAGSIARDLSPHLAKDLLAAAKAYA